MQTTAIPISSNVHDLESWNQSILSFDLDRIEAASADRETSDQVIEQSLAALFGADSSMSPVQYEPCDTFHCGGYWGAVT